MPSRLVCVLASSRSPATVIPSSGTNRRQFAHMTSDVSHGAPAGAPGARPAPVVRCGDRCSASLSHSIVNATRACDSSADSGSPFIRLLRGA
jgi:hypothetical protein